MRMNKEIIGTIASLFVLCAFSMKGEKNIRRIDMIGAILFVIYGISINAFSVYFLNSILLVIHIYKLIHLK